MAHLKLAVPKFNGDILKWDTFWTRFASNIDSDPLYTDVDKLAYLQEAIEDPSIDSSLFNGVKNDCHYSEVVRRLKERYDKPKKIHATYCKKLIQTSMIKHNKADLHAYADQLEHVLIGLKATEQFSAEAIVTSIALQRLPKVDKEAWPLQTRSEKMIRPPHSFIRERVDMVDAGLTDPESLAKADDFKQDHKPDNRKERRRDKTAPSQPATERPRHRVTIHASSSQPTYKFECKLCAPEHHPLYQCHKFREMDVKTRRETVRDLKLCSIVSFQGTGTPSADTLAAASYAPHATTHSFIRMHHRTTV